MTKYLYEVNGQLIKGIRPEEKPEGFFAKLFIKVGWDNKSTRNGYD